MASEMNVGKFRDRGRVAALVPAIARYFAPIEVIGRLRAAARRPHEKSWAAWLGVRCADRLGDAGLAE
jgi:hypothetical protein